MLGQAMRQAMVQRLCLFRCGNDLMAPQFMMDGVPPGNFSGPPVDQ